MEMLITEELRLSNDRAHSKAVRAERERNHTKLEKERTYKKLVNSTVHQRWIAAMARNITKQRSDHEKEMNKLKARYDHFFVLFLYFWPWISSMARNMTKQRSDHEKETNKLKARYDLLFFLFLYSIKLHSLSNILPS